MSEHVVVFSPHLDDATLSAAHRLMRPGSRVVTVFAGSPPARIDVTPWDRLTGATCSHDRYAERIAEDDLALAALGCESLRLSEPEDQYRTAPVEPKLLAETLTPHLAGASEVWAPAAIAGHPDHRAVRRAVVDALRGAGPGAPPLVLYADLPYSIRYGWPEWVSGEPSHDHLDPDFWLADELAKGASPPGEWTPHAHALTPDERAVKERAVLAYRTQLPALHLFPEEPRGWDRFLRYEVTWRLSS